MPTEIKLDVFIPTLNRADLLFESLSNLNEQRDQINYLHILDNGKQDLFLMPYNSASYLQETERNLGVAQSWNVGLETAFSAHPGDASTHMMALNDDIVLFPNQIKAIKVMLAHNPTCQFFWGTFTWSVWIMKRELYLYLFNKYGWAFDPGFYPAYCEDNDFHRRLDLDGIHYIPNLDVLRPDICRNSMTAKSNPVISHDKGLRYYEKKWGGKPGYEKWDVPFNVS